MRALTLTSVGMLAVMTMAVADAPMLTRIDNAATARESVTQLPTWLWGEWSRDWIQRGTVKSSTLDVHYLQTPTYFADIRIPKDRSGIRAAQSFADLTDQQLRLLATQIGFSGRTTMEGTVATWSDDIAFQPSDGTPDKGRLQRISADRMHELALDGSYIESWRHSPGAKGPFLVIRVEHSLRLLRTLVVGNQFVIQQSTLPWREGHHLEFVEQLSVNDAGTDPMPRAVGGDQWTVPLNTLSPREIKALFEG
jgi:hypothetical protein